MDGFGIKKLVRAFAVIMVVLAAVLLPKRNVGRDKKSAGFDAAFIDLLPNISFGLNLIAGDDPLPPFESTDEYAFIEVWNGTSAEMMPLEEYITFVTAAEMPASYSLEAIKAQAVAARTFALKHMRGEARCKSGHTICTSSACCQAFLDETALHERWGSGFDKYFSKIKSAVEATEGLVLTSGGKIVTALYHSSSGGRTEDCEAVFNVALPYLVSVESEGEENAPQFRSVKTFTKTEFVDAINAAFPDAYMTDPKKDVNIWERTDSGRISLIRLGGTVRTGRQLRKALKLKSTNAEFTITDDTVTITCLGFGHGVGMSQCGANAMAQSGADFVEILKHYYTGVEIERITAPKSLIKLLGAVDPEE